MSSLSFALFLFAGCIHAKPQTAADGIRDLLVGLELAEKSSHNQSSLEGCLVALSSLGSSLDVFEIQYGMKPKDAPGWSDVTKRANALLFLFAIRGKDEIYFNHDSAETAECVLLELAGRDQEALTRLDSIRPGGMCGNWIATVMQSVERRRAGIYQRRGDYAAALKHEEAARSHDGLSLYSPAPDRDGVRFGFLLEKTKRAAEAVPVYQRIVDLFPQTKGAELATDRLAALDALIRPTAERITKVYLGSEKESDYDAAIFALAKHKFPESFDILTEQLKTAKEWRRNRIIPALGNLGDQRAVPLLLELCKQKSDYANHLHAVYALHALGNDSEIASLLEVVSRRECSLDLDFADQLLREVHEGGPEIKDTWDIKPAEFSRIWREWINARQSNVNTPGH